MEKAVFAKEPAASSSTSSSASKPKLTPDPKGLLNARPTNGKLTPKQLKKDIRFRYVKRKLLLLRTLSSMADTGQLAVPQHNREKEKENENETISFGRILHSTILTIIFHLDNFNIRFICFIFSPLFFFYYMKKKK